MILRLLRDTLAAEPELFLQPDGSVDCQCLVEHLVITDQLPEYVLYDPAHEVWTLVKGLSIWWDAQSGTFLL